MLLLGPAQARAAGCVAPRLVTGSLCCAAAAAKRLRTGTVQGTVRKQTGAGTSAPVKSGPLAELNSIVERFAEVVRLGTNASQCSAVHGCVLALQCLQGVWWTVLPVRLGAMVLMCCRAHNVGDLKLVYDILKRPHHQVAQSLLVISRLPTAACMKEDILQRETQGKLGSEGVLEPRLSA